MIFSHFVFSFFFIFFFVFFLRATGKKSGQNRKVITENYKSVTHGMQGNKSPEGRVPRYRWHSSAGRRRMPSRRLGPGRMQWTRAECTDRHCCVFFDRADRRHTTSHVSGWCSRSMKRGTPQRSRSLPHLHLIQILDLSPDVISSNTLTEGPGCLLGLNHLK